MFISLNKKIIYTISFFFLLTALIFIYTFYFVYGTKIQEEQKNNILRNQQYIELLNDNINLRKEIKNIISEHNLPIISKTHLSSNIEELQVQELSKERKQIEELNKSYNERYEIIQEGIKIVALSAFIIALSIILLWILVRRWILTPIDKLSAASDLVASGNLKVRIQLQKDPFFSDELDNLSNTFNQMLESLEKSIKEIKSKEIFLQSLIDSIPDGIRVIDKDYNIIIANKEYYKQVNHSKEQKTCKCYASSQSFESPCPKGMFTCPVDEIINRNKKTIRCVQQFNAFPNRHLSINAASLHIKGEQNYVVESIRDLSDDINFSHQQKLSSIGFLATSVAHEMKNNLGSIRMITERLLDKFYQDKTDDNEEKKHLSLIHNQLIDCINVPERLLKLSRFSNSDELQELDCVDSIKEVIALLDFEAKRNGVTIDFESSSKEVIIKGYEADFKMVVMNLILNALKAMKNEGVLQIKIKNGAKDNIIITFQDNGIGIDSKNLHRIFEPFYSTGQNSFAKGTGLGLSIVKSIVEKFGGQIEVSSTIDVGSTFSLKFPNLNTKNKLQK